MHLGMVERHTPLSGHCDLHLDLWPHFKNNFVLSISPILIEIDIPKLVLSMHLEMAECQLYQNMVMLHIKLERAVDGAPSHIPMLKFLTPQNTPKSHPGAWPWQQNENSVQYVFYLLFVRTHTKFGIKSFKMTCWWYLTFWPSHKVTSLTLKWKCYLNSVLLVIPVDLILSHDHVWKSKLTPSATPVPKSPGPGAWPRQQNKNPVWYVLYFSFVRTHTYLV